MENIRVADYIADFIYKMGVGHVFLVSGGGMMFLSDGIASHGRLKWICNHHEQASAMAAVSYAKYNGNMGVAYVTTGCGGTNAITGLLNAWQDNTPCLFISGQVKRKETIRNSGLKLRQFGVQEADIISIVEPLTKYSVMVNDPDEIRYHLEKAVHIARSGRPGPVWIDVPLDVQGAVIDNSKQKVFSAENEEMDTLPEPSQKEIDAVISLLSKAQRPVIVAGQGVRLSGSIDKFKNFVNKHRIPVVVSRLGIDILDSDDPLFIGRIGNKGDRPGNFTVQNADLLLVIGSRLSVSSTGHEYDKFAREANIVVIDIDPEEHKKNTVKIDMFINSDAGKFIDSIKSVSYKTPEKWPDKCLEWKKKYPVCLPEYAKEKEGVNLYFFVDRLSRLMGKDAVIISDAGSSFFVASQAVRLKAEQRYITSGGQAEMGYTLPAAIGVSFARGGKDVLGITGDGSLQMNIQELQTLVHYDLPVKLFVWNNDGYMSIRATQSKFFGGRFIGTDSTSGVSFPDTKKIAEAYGIKYFKINSSDEVENIIKEVLAYPKAVICEVMCLRDQEIVPTVASIKKPDGTMVSMPIEDMYPFLPREEFLANMIVKPID